MPRLSRIRFHSVGHPNARLENLTIDLRGADGHATDSTIWLRNGGGKSSILNLFFATLRTRRRDFLGGRADSRRRSLEDYLLAGDQGAVITEWELDDPAGTLDVGERRRFLAGAFYEHRGATSDQLRRLFFATVSTPGIPETTLEGLPLTDLVEGLERKLTLTQFRQRWLALREAAPGLSPVATEVQSEWHEVLDQAGLDPDLFRYQLQMNLREGGADEIFRFEDDEAFVDFLLELTIDPERADEIGRTLATFREQLRRRQVEFLPDRKCTHGLLERFEPLRRTNAERARAGERLQSARQRLRALELALANAVGDARDRSAALARRRDEAFSAESTHRADAARMRREAVAWDYEASRMLHASAQATLDTCRVAETEARRRDVLYRAAGPLREARLRENEARAWRDEHASRSEALAPDLARVQDAASKLAAALRHRALSLTERRKELEERIADLERAQAQRAGRLRALSAAIGALEAELAQGEAAQTQRAQRLASLEREGLVDSGESVADALARHEARAAALEDQRALLLERADGLRDEIARTRSERSVAHEEIAAADRAARQAEAEAASAARAFDRLATDPRLLRLFELEQAPDWDTIPAKHATLLRRTAASLRARAATLRAEHFADERALAHLEDAGLLPAEVDVERAIAAIDRGAVSGWAWLARTIPSPARRNELVRLHPHLARGIIVTQCTVDEALALLEASGVEFRTPIVVAAPSAFDGPGRDDVRVHANGAAACHDPEAARTLLHRLRDRQQERTREADRLEVEADELLALGIEFAALRERFPVGYQAQRAAAAQHAEAEAAAARARAAAFDETSARLSETLHATTDEERRVRELAVASERAAARLHSVAHAEAQPATAHDRPSIERDLSEHRSSIQSLEQEVASGHLELTELRSSARTLAEEARLFETDASRVPHVDVSSVVPAPGDPDALRLALERELRFFEQKSGDDQALQMATRYEGMAADAHRAVRRALIDGVTPEDVAALLDETPDPDLLERRRDEATHRLTICQARVFEAEHQLRVAEKRRSAAEEAWRAERRPGLAASAETGREAERRALDLRTEADRCIERADATASEGQRLALQSERALHEAESRQKDAYRLSALRRAFTDLAPSPDGEPSLDDAAAAPAEATALDDLDTEVERIEAALRDAQGRVGELDRERRRAAEAVRRWCDHDDFAGLRSEVAGRIRALSDVALEEEAVRFTDQLTLRLAQLDAAIADGERHHAQVCRLVLDMAETGLRQVRLAASSSRVPERVPDIGGHHFLRITTSEPSDPGTRLALLSALVDELVTEKDIPTGPDLVRRAVRHLARPFRVRVLNPDTSAQRRTIPIADTAKFSGGEQLTCAILLYCTLANVRARNRGRARQPSSVLLLDNPVGRASRRRFLEMQREFARAMGVQLVYTTAVNDHEALSVLPNVIRLRNERVDRGRGHRLVEFDEETEEHHGRVEGARIARVETEPTGLVR